MSREKKTPSEATVSAWIKLVRAHRAALGGIEAALKAADLPPLSWYDLLLELKRAPDGLRHQELEARMLLPQYNISRLADRLEAAGYLEKTIDAADARGRVLTITPAGRALQKKMWPVYASAIERFVGARLTQAEARAAATLLSKMVD